MTAAAAISTTFSPRISGRYALMLPPPPDCAPPAGGGGVGGATGIDGGAAGPFGGASAPSMRVNSLAPAELPPTGAIPGRVLGGNAPGPGGGELGGAPKMPPELS